MASSNKRMMSSAVARRKPIPATIPFMVAWWLKPRELATFAIVAHQIHDALRQFTPDLMAHGGHYTQERLSALVIQPGYWKLTTAMIRQQNGYQLPSQPLSLRRVAVLNFTCLDILEDLTLLEDLTILRHACDQRRCPSEFAFGQWTSGLKKVTLNDPDLLVLPSLARLPIIDFLDLSGCNQLQSVAPLVACESLTTLILNGCSALEQRALLPLARLSTPRDEFRAAICPPTEPVHAPDTRVLPVVSQLI
jgi:hypothetical protein